MKLCDRCRVSGCLLTYGGKACREARKQECPDVVFTRADQDQGDGRRGAGRSRYVPARRGRGQL